MKIKAIYTVRGDGVAAPTYVAYKNRALLSERNRIISSHVYFSVGLVIYYAKK